MLCRFAGKFVGAVDLLYTLAMSQNGNSASNRKKALFQFMSTLTGKVAVITGSTRGLGLAIAQTYAEAGAAVIISSRTASAVDAAVESFRAEGRQAAGLACDVADLKQVQALRQLALDSFGGLDIWVNNAGVAGAYGPTLGVPPERYVQVIQTNIVGTYYGSRVAMQHFLGQGRGKLINMLGRGDHKPVPMQNAYAPSKTWVRSFTLALAKEYKKSGVGVFAFNPGLVDTDMLRQIEVVPGHEEDFRAGKEPAGRGELGEAPVEALRDAGGAGHHQMGMRVGRGVERRAQRVAVRGQQLQCFRARGGGGAHGGP